MKHNAFRSLAFLLVLVLLLPLCIGCGNVEEPPQTTAGTTEAETPNTELYQYPDVDYQKETFTIMGCEPKYEMITNILADELNGSAVNDAQYEMTAFIEEKFNIDLVEERIGYYSEKDTLTPIVASNDPHYDMVYLQISNVGSLFSSDYLVLSFTVVGLRPQASVRKPLFY